MAEVKWIKIVTDIFDDEKMLLIESLPSADSLIVIWFKLLCLAGKNNNDGVFIMNDRIPYTEEMLSTIFRRDINIVRLALNTFEQFGMIEIVNGVITIPNWGKHQTLDSYEKKKARDKLYQAERRAKQKQLTEKSSDESSDKSSDVAISDIDIEKEIDIEREKDNNNPPTPLKRGRTKKESNLVILEDILRRNPQTVLPEDVVAVLREWMEYKDQRKELYVERGMKSLLTQVYNALGSHSSEEIVECIRDSMACNYQGVTLDKLNRKSKASNRQSSSKQSSLDEWAARKDGVV